MSFRKPFYRRAAWMAVLVCAAWLVAAVATVPASAHVGHPSKATKRLSAAAKVRNRADHRLVKAAHKLKSCVRHHGRRHCSKQRHALQHAGIRLERAQRHLRRLARHRGHAGSISYKQAAPVIKVSGQTLRWSAVRGVSSYIFVKKVPGQADNYSVVSKTSITPPAVPGTTVRYGLRTNVAG